MININNNCKKYERMVFCPLAALFPGRINLKYLYCKKMNSRHLNISVFSKIKIFLNIYLPQFLIPVTIFL